MVIVSEMEQLMDQTNVEPVKQTYRNFHGAGWRVKNILSQKYCVLFHLS